MSILYTDGSCLGNPGPGGWAFLVLSNEGKVIQEKSGAAPDTTNNRMELLAVIEGLKSFPEGENVKVVTDSKYVCNAFLENWIGKWIKNGFKTAKGEVKNLDLWKELIALAGKRNVNWEWVKGHDSNPYNKRCDELAVMASKGQSTQRSGNVANLQTSIHFEAASPVVTCPCCGCKFDPQSGSQMPDERDKSY